MDFCSRSVSSFCFAADKSLQSCLTLCDPIDGSLRGSPVARILQARRLEWVAISFSNAWKWKVKEKSLSRVWLLETSWTAAYQAPLSMGFSGQEYWSGVPFPSLSFCFKPKQIVWFSNYKFWYKELTNSRKYFHFIASWCTLQHYT